MNIRDKISMIKEGKISEITEAKYNQKDYKFYVVVDGKIESGWEYKEDAKEQLDELPNGKKGRVYAKSFLKRISLDANSDLHWHTAASMKESHEHR